MPGQSARPPERTRSRPGGSRPARACAQCARVDDRLSRRRQRLGRYAIRGFKANNDIFVDSIRTPGNVIPDVFSVEQIEIYKGPSGGIADRSTIGGVINIINKQPDLNFDHCEPATTVGTDNMFRSTIDLNQIVTHDFAVRANVMYDQHDVAGRDITESERWGGLISVTAKPTDDLKVTPPAIRPTLSHGGRARMYTSIRPHSGQQRLSLLLPPGHLVLERLERANGFEPSTLTLAT